MTTPTLQSNLAAAAVGEVKANANALGITWQMRPGIVETMTPETGIASVIPTGDDAPIEMISLVDGLRAGDRVMSIFVPPSGNYVVGITKYANNSTWNSYAMVTVSTGTAPTVGAGSQGARWTQLNYRTILFEGYVLFGAGMNQGTGRYFFPVPFRVSTAGFAATGSGYIFDSGTANRGAFAVNFTSARDQLFLTNTPSGDVGAGVPQVFASGDQILFSIVYEAESL